MPGFLLDASATVLCAHGGKAASPSPVPRVKIMGQPVVTQPVPFPISACAYPPVSGGPCAVAQWTSGATRIKAMGQPVLLADSKAVCSPTGVPVTIIPTQTRVQGM